MLKASSNAPPSHQVRIQQTLLLSMSRVQTNDKSTQSNDFWSVEVMKWHPNTSLTCNSSRKICIPLWWRDFAELVIFAFLICYLYSVRGQEPLHHYAVWHYILRELSTIQRIQDFGFCIFNIEYKLTHWHIGLCAACLRYHWSLESLGWNF